MQPILLFVTGKKKAGNCSLEGKDLENGVFFWKTGNHTRATLNKAKHLNFTNSYNFICTSLRSNH